MIYESSFLPFSRINVLCHGFKNLNQIIEYIPEFNLGLTISCLFHREPVGKKKSGKSFACLL